MVGLLANAGYRYQHVSVGDQDGSDGDLLFGLGNQLRLNSVRGADGVHLGRQRQCADEPVGARVSTIGDQGTATGYVEEASSTPIPSSWTWECKPTGPWQRTTAASRSCWSSTTFW